MSSTTDRGAGRHPSEGQVLVLFAGALTLVMLIAALAFDIGMVLLERRDQQNAADAGALAGARYVFTSANFNGVCPDSGLTGNQAVDTACEITRINGYDHDADASETINVYIPPLHGRYTGLAGFIEVKIASTRPSIFAGVIGRVGWPVGAFGVATPAQNLSFSFGMIALDPTQCKALQVSGTGIINSYGTIQSNSNGSECTTGGPVGFSRTGGSTINVFADDATCRSVGEIQDQGSGAMTCTQAEGSWALPDPLKFLPAPPKPPLAAAMVPVGHTKTPPANCPGSSPSEANPQLCRVGNGQYANRAWRLYPGLYPGGLELTNGTTVYLAPGIYWIGGGGFVAKNDASIITIAGTETDSELTSVNHDTWDAGGGAILIYNSQLSTANGDAANSPGGAIHLNGGGATMWLKPFFAPDTIPDSCADYSCYNDIVIYQDRAVAETVTLNGSSSITEVEGMIYVPSGEIVLNGNGGTLDTDQVIANSVKINGDGGTININKNTDFEATIVAAGLVD